MLLSSCLTCLKSLCVGTLLLFSPGAQVTQPKEVQLHEVMPPVCLMKNVQICRELNSSAYGLTNSNLIKHFSHSSHCPQLYTEPASSAVSMYGCNPGDEICASSVAVYGTHFMYGGNIFPVSPEEIDAVKREVNFVGETTQRRCEEQRKPFKWDAKDFERRGFVQGYRIKQNKTE